MPPTSTGMAPLNHERGAKAEEQAVFRSSTRLREKQALQSNSDFERYPYLRAEFITIEQTSGCPRDDAKSAEQSISWVIGTTLD